MSRGFMKGLIFGGIIGAVVAAFTSPQLKPTRKIRVMMGTSRKMGKNMHRMYKDVRGGMNDMMD